LPLWQRLRRKRVALAAGATLLALLLACLLVPWLGPWRYDQTDLLLGPTPPSWSHPMGTDYFGRDLMVRICVGGRVSFAVGVVATAVSLLIGVGWGGLAGYLGGRVDAVMMRLVDLLYTFPFLVLIILLTVLLAGRDGALYAAYLAAVGAFGADASDPAHFSSFQIAFVVAALGAVSWLTMARIVRGQVLALRRRPFVLAARAIGVGHLGIIVRHLVPNAFGPVLAYAALTVPQVMLVEAFLSFLGLGIQEPLASWGLLVAAGAETMDLCPWLLGFPALMLTLTLLCLNALGDALRDALDPRPATNGPRAGSPLLRRAEQERSRPRNREACRAEDREACRAEGGG